MMLASLAFALALPAPTAQGIGSSAVELESTHASEHFELRYRPDSRAGAAIDRTAHLLELEYAEILGELGIKGKVDESSPFLIFLYDDLAELEAITKVGGTGGFSAGRESHIPWENDQTRKHELVHIVVAAMESTGNEGRNMFFAEGISNAVLEFVHGIPVHSVAAYELERGSLPSLEVLVSGDDFYGYLKANPGFNGYDVGGSFFLYLLETNKPKKVMDYYHGKPAKKALGKSLAQLEKGWHARLRSFPVRPELHVLLSQRRGDGGEFSTRLTPDQRLPQELLGEPADWTGVLADVVPLDEIGSWTFEENAVLVENSDGASWTMAEVPELLYSDCVLRAQLRTGGGCWGIKVRYGDGCRAMVLGQGAFIYTEGGGVAHTGDVKLQANAEVDLILHVAAGHARVYLDGNLILETSLQLKPARIGLGLVGGSATFSSFAVRKL